MGVSHRKHPVDGDQWLHPYAGSNNWVIGGDRTESGYPMMANDPHRSIAVPSLRYWVHLNAPGWNVIGGGEPTIPGVSIGHNEHGAWGLTVFFTDSEDIYVYETNPNNPNQYRYDGEWEEMRIVPDTIQIRGESPVEVSLKYTRHGPVVFENKEHHTAYALRAAWREIGGAPYLASLRMDQAETWAEFREACTYSNMPGENMVWADKNGAIGWQVVGIAPIRRNWSGLVPVPGDGRYEWDGYRSIRARPRIMNPPQGWWTTANSNLISPDYPDRNAVGWYWSDPFRYHRIVETLETGRHSLGDMMRLQTDYLSIPARTLIPLLKNLRSEHRQVERARRILMDWDFQLTSESIAAGIYVAWERSLFENVYHLMVPQEAQDLLSARSKVQMSNIIDWLLVPPVEFGTDPIEGRDELLISSLEEAVEGLTNRLGGNMERWQYGQADYKHVTIRHPLSHLVEPGLRKRLNMGPLPRAGNSYTIVQSGSGDNQTFGPTFRILVDTQDWDRSLGMNAPGQSGDPDSPHYDDLFRHWAEDKYFPVYFSREKVESAAKKTTVLTAP